GDDLAVPTICDCGAPTVLHRKLRWPKNDLVYSQIARQMQPRQANEWYTGYLERRAYIVEILFWRSIRVDDIDLVTRLANPFGLIECLRIIENSLLCIFKIQSSLYSEAAAEWRIFDAGCAIDCPIVKVRVEDIIVIIGQPQLIVAIRKTL